MRRGTLVGTLALALAAGSLAGCSSGGDDAASKAATKLATGLSSYDVGKVAWSDPATATKAYAATVAGAKRLPVKVSAGDATTKGSTGTAPLHWDWTVGTKHWTYTTTAHLKKTAGGTWQVAWSPALVEPRLTEGASLQAVTIKAARGDILGAGGKALVTERPVLRFGIDRTKVPAAQAAASARALAQALDLEVAPYVKQVTAAGPKAFVQALVLRRGQASQSLLARVNAIKGAVYLADTLPLAPTKEFGVALLGTVGQATAAIVKSSRGRVAAGDDTGLSGLEERYDEQLSGTKGYQIDLVDAKGGRTVLFKTAAVAGKPLTTTLDAGLETDAQSILDGVGPASALVAIRPSTGAIVAAASGPGSDGYDTATYGQYAPGSTFKMISSLALFRAGMTPSTKVVCSPSLDVDGRRFTNDSDYPSSALGTITLADAFANSCNTAYIRSRTKLSGDDLEQAAAALGLGVDHDLGFPAYFGQVEKPASETERAADMIGQGKDLASPMAMAAVTASVVAGHVVTPRLITSVKAPTVSPAKPLTAAEARELRTMMRGVVTHGTGAGLADLSGPPVLAKTGTAQYGTKEPLLSHAWMVAAQGDLAVAVFVATGTTGAGTAGPLLKQFLEDAHR